ncbi:GIN domain-containing protein [Novosphingobium album (ex Liu et al. 2023)]|uniref:DUF2807 domain-containing protein n=1 Tax=Novosphingobium album (ex Liu et al. 2023) TaxID=3031130 RepID=A0ABT5WPR1_9SPHN|nr:DUF2807 domain-containing protein [Novosphingobium album (ex Liu et al. 2023)]MDE8651746.1 DUF2807 domain-containing protein [Novosphingobium album (ex Liu et al. 2023)]
MLKKLLVVFASGTILCVVALGLAWVVGGKELHQSMLGGEGFNISFGPDAKGPRKTRTFAIDSGQTLTMEVPVDLHFSRGDEAKMVVRGPAAAIDRLVWENGHLSLKGPARLGHGLDVTIVAPQIAGLDLEAPGDIALAGLQQDQFRLRSEGAVDLTADGKVRRLDIRAAGASDLDLARLDAEDATVRVDGMGDVSIAATRNVDVEINGAGNVTLHRKPAHLRSAINGVGSIDHEY